MPLLPIEPGVYWFIGSNKQVLYVGKAKNLKQRVRSYTHLGLLSSKISRMVSEAKELKFSTVETELDALLVEAELVRLHQPRFNSQLKDDKSPLYIYFTNDDIPIIKTGRWKDVDVSLKQNAIFGPFTSGFTAVGVMNAARKIFPFCGASKWQLRLMRPCFYYHLGQCPGICVGAVSPTEYKKSLLNLKLFLKGKRHKLLLDLKRQLKKLVKLKNFEEAIIIRDQIILLTPRKNIHRPFDLDLPQLLEDKVLDRLVSLRGILRKHFSLPRDYPLERIEAYDISNTSGTNATGSMVVLKNGKIDKTQYRKFRIRKTNGPNDVAMLTEVLKRRFKHEEWGLPQLIIVDGGRTQLKAALSVIGGTLPVVGLVKNPERMVVFDDKTKKFRFEHLSVNQPWSRMMVEIRDESHRFAKKYHSLLREKALTANLTTTIVD